MQCDDSCEAMLKAFRSANAAYTLELLSILSGWRFTAFSMRRTQDDPVLLQQLFVQWIIVINLVAHKNAAEGVGAENGCLEFALRAFPHAAKRFRSTGP